MISVANNLWMAKVALATECYPWLYEEGEGEISMSFALSLNELAMNIITAVRR